MLSSSVGCARGALDECQLHAAFRIRRLARDLRLEEALGRPWAERRPIEFGDLAWLCVFDDDDQMEFHRELHEALVLTLAADSTEPVDRCVREWRTTARALSDAARRAVLVGAVTDEDLRDVDRPA